MGYRGCGGGGERSDAAGNWKHNCSRGRRDGEGEGEREQMCTDVQVGRTREETPLSRVKVLLVDAALRLVDAAPLFMNICAVNLSLQPQKTAPPHLHYPTPPPSDSAT